MYSCSENTTQETIEALGGMDIMPKHSDICRCRYMSAYLSYHLDSLIIQAHMSTRHVRRGYFMMNYQNLI